MKTILLIVDPARIDTFIYFEQDKKNKYYLLHREKNSGGQNLPNFIQNEFFWTDFKTPAALLNKVKPDTIVFQEVIDLKQIALNVSAKYAGIETIFLDHGLWINFEPLLAAEKKLLGKIKKAKVQKLKKPLKIAANYFFYFSVINKVSAACKKNLLRFCWYCFRHSTVFALDKVKFEERKPHRFVLFNQNNFETMANYYDCQQQEVTYTGFPYFDSYYHSTEIITKDYLVFIDHPYLEDSYLNWDHAYHKKLATHLYELAKKVNRKVIIKLHPRSDLALWKSYGFDTEYFQPIQQTVDEKFYLEAEMILGYSSTLMVGFICAKKNVVLVGWHPEPGIFGIDFSTYGVCHGTSDFDDINTCYEYWRTNNLTVTNPGAYNNFIGVFNSPFDGKAAERIVKEIAS